MHTPRRKKQRTTSPAFEAPSTTSSSGLASAAAAAESEMIQAQLRTFYNDPWLNSLKQVDVKAHSDAKLDVSGVGVLVKRCAVTHQERKAVKYESAHLVPARAEDLGSASVFRGQLDVELLKRAQVVPAHAHVNSQANRIQHIHKDLDSRSLDMLPNQDQIISRINCVIKFQQERAAANSSGENGVTLKLPARPPFDKFHAAAEQMGACFRLIASNRRESPNILRLVWPSTQKPSPGQPFLPSLIEPVSMVVLIWAIRERVRRKPPSPSSLMRETSILDDFITLLLAFWFLMDDTLAADIAALIGRAKTLVKEHGGPAWVQQLENLAAQSYVDIVNAVTFPANALRSQDPPPTPEQHALMLDAAAAHDDASTTFSDDLSDIDSSYLDSPPQLNTLPYPSLTPTAVEVFESSALSSANAIHVTSSCALISGVSSWLANVPQRAPAPNAPRSV
ncbi:hypothetical protein Rt10032_c11g4409 [Rhodotorula toruloides]|uniref:Proteophosphoglycan ppg4 n=1 Tax=Rhodotorula toruloides TaxID=5286 RepID=A0A511KJ33_RHOTO|nr:hypothetical protein Rt10032_c11g4409 [Rhodotorula toruloides]